MLLLYMIGFWKLMQNLQNLFLKKVIVGLILNIAQIYKLFHSKKENDMYNKILDYDPNNIKILGKTSKQN